MEYFIIYKTLDSTNKEAHRRITSGAVKNGLTLLASHQTEGKGQLGRPWQADPGRHLAMTIILQPSDLPPAQLPAMSMKISFGIVKALQAFFPGLQPRIKWPNDIYVHHKKISGILIENTLAGNKVQYCIIGIGINVNEAGFPPELPHATSLFLETGMETDIISLAHEVRQSVMDMVFHTPPDWYSAYSMLIYGKGEKHWFESGADRFSAEVKGINPEGLLLLESEDSSTRAYGTHEIKWQIST